VAAPRVVQHPSPDELDAIRALEARAAAADGHESLGAAAWRDLERPQPGSFGVLEADDGVVHGYLHAAPADSTAAPHLHVAAVVEPGGPDRAARLAALVHAATAELGARGAAAAAAWVADPGPETDAVFGAAGWHPAREQLQMQVPLPLAEAPRWPPGVVVRPFRPGTDDGALVAVNNRAFAGHPEQGGWTTATLARRTAEPGFDPDDVLMAWDEEGLAGFDWTKVHPESATTPRLGEIYVIGVDPARQGRGLGRALVVAGLDHLARARGCPRGLLYVAADNTAGIALYRALGFTVSRTDRAYGWP
jgi:mycothiol synthase